MKEQLFREFRDRKFGLFLHWGLYAVPGGRWKGETMDYIGEWIQSKYRIPSAEYTKLASQFNPVRFDADRWIGKAAAAGIRYIVYTAKHHEGFAMYRSAASPFNIADATPFGRDPLAELAEACRKYGVKLGIYYSQFLDWHEADGGDPGPDFPLNFGMSWGNDWDFPDLKAKRFERYFYSKALPQLTELLTGYGPVAELWCDCPLSIEPRFSRELRDHVHRLQPDCLINSRIGHDCGDYGSLGDNQTSGGRSVTPQESPATLNDTWGFKYDDRNWKSPGTVIGQLAALAEQDINYLLNIGPQPDGALPEAAERILDAVAEWFAENGDAIHGTSGTPFPQSLDFAFCTKRETQLFFLLKKPCSQITVNGIGTPVKHASVPFRQEGESVVLTLPDFGGRSYPCVTLEFGRAPEISSRLMPQNGILSLAPQAGTPVAAEAPEATDETGTVNVAGERTGGEPGCRLENDGSLADWHHPGDRIEWNCSFPEGGTFRIRLTTRNRNHSSPWNGAREVELRWRGVPALRTRLAADRTLPGDYYPAAESDLGEFRVGPGESGILSLHTTGAEAPAADMALVSLDLEKDNSAEAE